MKRERERFSKNPSISSVGEKVRGRPLSRRKKEIKQQRCDKLIIENSFNSSNPCHTRTNMNAFLLEFRLTWCQEGNQNESWSDWASCIAQEGKLTGLMRPQENGCFKKYLRKTAVTRQPLY